MGEEESVRHPAALYRLHPGDRGFEQGARVQIVDLKGDAWFAKNLPAAQAFLQKHGMTHINEDEIERLRAEMKQGDSSPEK